MRYLIFDATSEIYVDLAGEVESAATVVTLAGFRTPKSDQVSFSLELDREQFDRGFTIFPGVTVPAGDHRFERIALVFETGQQRRLAFSGGMSYGGFYDRHRRGASLTVTARPNRHLRVGGSWRFNEVDLPSGSFETHLFGQNLDIFWTPELSFRSFVQYNNVRETLSWNARLQWTYRPGSDVYLVVQQIWDDDGGGLQNLAARDRQVLLKATFAFAR